jgi:hypothetical protein
VARARVGVAAVAAVGGSLEVTLVVGLYERDLVVAFVLVVGGRVVDVPDEQSLAGQRAVEAGSLAVLDQEILL